MKYTFCFIYKALFIHKIAKLFYISKEDYQKALKKLTLFFSDALPDPIWWCIYEVIWSEYIKWYEAIWVIVRIISFNLCKSIHGILNYSTFFHLPFLIREKWEGTKKSAKISSISRVEGASKWNKNIFFKLLKGYHLVKQ